jgi:hypothetical protein
VYFTNWYDLNHIVSYSHIRMHTNGAEPGVSTAVTINRISYPRLKSHTCSIPSPTSAPPGRYSCLTPGPTLTSTTLPTVRASFPLSVTPTHLP